MGSDNVFLIDRITWESIKSALVTDTSLKERRAVALAVELEPITTMCKTCTAGKMPRSLVAWALFKDDSPIFFFTDEDVAEKASKALKYEKRQIQVGWK